MNAVNKYIERMRKNNNDFKNKNHSFNLEEFKLRDMSSFGDENLIIIGIRRVGKTEYLNYFYNTLSNEQKDKMLFVDFDNVLFYGYDFRKSFDAIENIVDAIYTVIREDNIKFLLLDEVQRLHNWSSIVKGIVDLFPEIRIIGTGSDSVSLAKSHDSGIGRFKIKYVSVLNYSEYYRIHGNNEKSHAVQLIEHLDNFVLPKKEYNNPELMFELIYEKQFNESNFSRNNLRALIRVISNLPGQPITANLLSKHMKEEYQSSSNHNQVDDMLDFLVESQLLIKIPSYSSINKLSRVVKHKYYLVNWNTYKINGNKTSYKELDNESVPIKGFIFENYVVSNIYSSMHSRYERSKLYFDDGDNDVDIIIGNTKYEIKSFDIFYVPENQRNSIIEKAKKLKSKILHTGETKILNGVEIINVGEFLVQNKF